MKIICVTKNINMTIDVAVTRVKIMTGVNKVQVCEGRGGVGK